MVEFHFTAKDGTRVVIREPSSADAPQLMMLINSVICEPMSGLMINERIGLADERKWVAGRIKEIRARRVVQLVAVVDGTIHGNCDIVRRRYKESHRAVLGIVIDGSLRGKGVGEAMMKRAIQVASRRMKGLEQIDLQTFSYNKRAQSLYRKLGFVQTGYVPRAIKEGRKYYGELVMALRL